MDTPATALPNSSLQSPSFSTCWNDVSCPLIISISPSTPRSCTLTQALRTRGNSKVNPSFDYRLFTTLYLDIWLVSYVNRSYKAVWELAGGASMGW
jgi:hypothetical protein